jgi:starch synthase (maltosyl-transferring)
MTLPEEGRKRVVIERVQPEIDAGRFPIKRIVGEEVVVLADILGDGHDLLAGSLLFRSSEENGWSSVPMRFEVNDRWRGRFTPEHPGVCFYTIEAWVDHFKSWQQDLKKKHNAGQNVEVELGIGLTYIEEAAKRAPDADARRLIELAKALRAMDRERTLALALDPELSGLMERYPDRRFATRYEKELAVVVDRPKALFSAWYERFPRSCGDIPGRHGTLKDCARLLPQIARMGFDIFYFPPIHPIGKTNRKGKNNASVAGPDDPGSPWAIGSQEGGHTAIDPRLGSVEDFDRLVEKAKEAGVEIALDLAFQCSPDHPYVKAHPEWFRWRPDGTVQYAENPPKKYEDIIPLNFESDGWRELWAELRDVVLFWVDHGVRIFRVDNPHTKPFAFWDWLIAEIKREHPDVIFLAEAFTRPKLMYGLAKRGFTQSYTYFSWRTSKRELIAYLTELTQTEVGEYFRPNFWPNTPDILPEHLQYGGRAAFLIRLVLAATLSSSYGIYGPAFELCLGAALPGSEEYLDSEKYEIKHWDWNAPGNIKDFIARVNRIRRENPALQATRNLKFHSVENDHLLVFSKATPDLANIILTAVNLDPFQTQSGWVHLPLGELGIDPAQPYLVHDLISDDKYIWQGERNYVELNPHVVPGHIFSVRRRLRREADFDYFM